MRFMMMHKVTDALGGERSVMDGRFAEAVKVNEIDVRPMRDD